MILNIQESFLKEETRDGFTICEKMKRCWATQLKLVALIDDICQKHGLRWFADYGTLLGAVRHGGFIPWDDDMDITMLREDYDKLMQILPQELPSECQTMRFGTNENLWRGWSNVNNRHNIDTGDDLGEAIITRVWFDNPYIDGIDIYPLDYVPADKGKREDMLSVYEDLLEVLRSYPHDAVTAQQKELCDVAEAVARSCSRENACGVGNITNMAHCGLPYREMIWYDHALMVPFEMIQIPIPSGYPRILRSIYGDKWYIPKQTRGAHDYPFYAAQDEYIKNYKAGSARA